MEIFNINDYKKTTDINLDELDDRYINTTGDTIETLFVKNMQLLDIDSAISFSDGSIQTKAYNQGEKDEIYDHVNDIINDSSASLLTSNNIFTGTNDFDDISCKQFKIFDTNGQNFASQIYQNPSTSLNIDAPYSLGAVNFWVAGRRAMTINTSQLNLWNNTDITNVKAIRFTNGTEQTTAFQTSMLNNIQNQVSSIANGKTQFGTFFDSPNRGQNANSEISIMMSYPDPDGSNNTDLCDIMSPSTSVPYYYFQFKQPGLYKFTMSWSHTKTYINSNTRLGVITVPYYPNPIPSIPNPFPPNSSNNTPNSNIPLATHMLYLTWTPDGALVNNRSFPSKFYDIHSHSFTGYANNSDGADGINIRDTTIKMLHVNRWHYEYKGLKFNTNTNEIGNNRFYLDMTFELKQGDPMTLYTHFAGFAPDKLNEDYRFNVNDHKYSITKLG